MGITLFASRQTKSMSGDLIGGAVHAVLIPPQAERFAALVAVDLDGLGVNVTGWNKLVLLTDDRAFLFPRRQVGVEWFEREIGAYRALAETRLSVVPRLLGCWHDADIYPFPFAAVTRLPGRTPTAPDAFIEQLGRATASWHQLQPPRLQGARPPRHHDAPHHQWLRRSLNPTTTMAAVREAAERLGRPERIPAWTDLLATAAALPHVLVHGDIHEDQLLTDDGQLTGIIDWETARVDHPFWDFDLSEWGTDLWRAHRHEFSVLWARWWRAYANERGLNLDSRPLELGFRLRQALRLLDGAGDPAVAGTIEEHLAHL